MQQHTTNPLNAYLQVQSRDPDEVYHAASQLMNEHDMSLRAAPARFQGEISAADLGELGLLRFRYGTEVSIAPHPLDSFMTIHVPVRGSFHLEHTDGDHRVSTGMAAIVSPQDHIKMRWSDDLELLVLRIDVEALTRQIGGSVTEQGNRSVKFQPTLKRGYNQSLLSTIFSLQSFVDEQGPSRINPVLTANFRDLLVNLLLTTVHNTHLTLNSLERRATATTDPLGEAQTFMQLHHAEPLTVARVAHAVFVSERTLYHLFREHLGTTPMAWLRAHRLERARATLTSLPNPHGNVSNIATLHGFSHAGRFARAYEQVYGEHPSQTLHRTHFEEFTDT